MRTLIKTNKGSHPRLRDRQRVSALWLLAAFSWFGILVPNFHQAAGSASDLRFAQRAAVPATNHCPLPSRTDGRGEDRVLLSARCEPGSGECLLCAWLASAAYTLAVAPQSRLCCVVAPEKTPTVFRLAARCVRGVPCRIPRGPPVRMA